MAHDGLDTDDLNGAIEFLEPSSSSHESAGGPYAGYKMCNSAPGLLYKLFAGRLIVCSYVGGVIKLVRHIIEVPVFGHYFMSKADRPICTLFSRAQYKLCSKSLQHLPSFQAYAGRHGKLNSVFFC